MKRTNLLIIFTLILLSVKVHAQSVAGKPDRTLVDQIKLNKIKMEVDKINSISLICDTIINQPYDKDSVRFEFKGICFDEQGRLRKYFRTENTNDGDHGQIEMFAYFNENGELIYISIDASSHCNSGNEVYYIDKGNIVDFAYSYYCGCCEKDDDVSKWITSPVVGNPLTVSINWKLELRNFIHADALLKILRKNNYSDNEEFERD